MVTEDEEQPEEAVLRDIRERVDEAVADMEMFILVVGETTTAREITDFTHAAGHGSTISNLAFWRMVEDGTLEINDDLSVTVK